MALTLILITLAYILIIALEVPRLLAQKKWRELTAFSLLLLPAMAYSYGIAFDVHLPNPTRMIEGIFKPLALQLEKIFGTAL